MRQLLAAINDNGLNIPSITFNGGRTLSLQQIADNLVESMDLVFKKLTGAKKINGVKIKDIPNYIAGKALFENTEELPDGSALYGVVLNSKSVAVGGFGEGNNDEGDGQDLTINNVDIKGLRLNVNEIPVLYFDKCYDSESTSNTIQKGPFGDVFDLRKAVSESDAELIESHSAQPDILNGIEYIGNPLADAQIAVGVFRDYVAGEDYGFGTSIDDKLVSWAKGESSFPSSCAGFVCNGDIMFHTNKGLFTFLHHDAHF